MPGGGGGFDDDDLGIEQLQRLLESTVREAADGDPLAVEMLGVVSDMADRALGVPPSLVAAPAVVVITVRVCARRLGAALADALVATLSVRSGDLARDPERALPYASAVGAALSQARGLLADLGPGFDLGLDLDRDIQLAQRLTDVLARSASFDVGQATSLCADLLTDLRAARPRVNDLVLGLGNLPVDASGADLSALEVSGLRALDGVTWTRETTWPPAIAARVQAHSAELQPGVYTIHIRCR